MYLFDGEEKHHTKLVFQVFDCLGHGLITGTYLVVFFVCWQRNPTFERFYWNTNAENSSWLGKECAYCLSKGKLICLHEPFQLCFSGKTS